MRQGGSDRDIVAGRVMGRPKAAQWRRAGIERGWQTSPCLPDDEAVAAALAPHKASTTVFTLTRFAAKVRRRQRD